MNEFARLIKQNEYRNTLEEIREKEIALQMLRERELKLRLELEG